MKRRAHLILALLAVALGAAAIVRPAPAQSSELLDPGQLRELSFQFQDADWQAALQRLAATDEYVHADLQAEGQALADVGLRIKGNSSSRAPGQKEPLNLGLDAFVAGQRLSGYDTLNLNNMFVDPTLVREVLTYQVLRPYLPVPRATYARMNANGRYFGLYTLVEQIEKTYLRSWFPSAGGYLFKADPPGGLAPQPRLTGPQQAGRGPSDLAWLGEDLARYQAAYELKTTDAGEPAWVALRELTRALDAPVGAGGVTGDGFPAALERVFDVDGALWYVAAHNLLANFDNYYSGHNFYLYRSPEDGRFHMLSWDMNESFGVFRTPDNTPVTSAALARVDPFMAVSPTSGRPLLRRLLTVPRYRADYLAHYRTLLAEVLDLEHLTAGAGRLQDLIRESARTDPNPLYPFALFERGLWEDLSLSGSGGAPGGGRPVPGVLLLARLRGEYLRGRADLAAPDLALARHDRSPEPVRDGQPARVAVALAGADAPAAVTLVYQVNYGPPVVVPMTATDGAYTATLPAQPTHTEVRYYARAELADGRSAFFPAANWTQPWAYTVTGPELPAQPGGSLVINELQADNKTTISDPNEEFDDWVELHNRGDQPVSLAGHFLSDDPADPHQFALPAQSVPPGGYLLIWCDGEPEQGADHASFKLDKDGESVLLSSADAVVDQVDFGLQGTDRSHARQPDGTGAWVDCDTPSPRAANRCGGGAATPTATARATATATATRPANLDYTVYLPWAAKAR